MIRLPPRATRTYTPFPYTTLFRSWMTAGRGILHSEMPQQENGLMWGFQLWVNLPAKDKMTAPRYQDIGPERIPVVRPAEGVEVDRKSTRLNSSHQCASRMPSSA